MGHLCRRAARSIFTRQLADRNGYISQEQISHVQRHISTEILFPNVKRIKCKKKTRTELFAKEQVPRDVSHFRRDLYRFTPHRGRGEFRHTGDDVYRFSIFPSRTLNAKQRVGRVAVNEAETGKTDIYGTIVCPAERNVGIMLADINSKKKKYNDQRGNVPSVPLSCNFHSDSNYARIAGGSVRIQQREKKRKEKKKRSRPEPIVQTEISTSPVRTNFSLIFHPLLPSFLFPIGRLTPPPSSPPIRRSI